MMTTIKARTSVGRRMAQAAQWPRLVGVFSLFAAAAAGCSRSNEGPGGPCTNAPDLANAGISEPLFSSLVHACNTTIASGCFDVGIDAASPCSLCVGLLDYQTGEILHEYDLNRRARDAAELTKAEVAQMMAECIARSANCAAMDKCTKGCFLNGWSMPCP